MISCSKWSVHWYRFFPIAVLVIVVIAWFSPTGQAFTNGYIWSREEGTVVSVREAAGVISLTHTGEKDWAISDNDRIPVKPGDKFEIEANLAFNGPGAAETGVILRDENGNPLRWSFGGKQIFRSDSDLDKIRHFRSIFTIPHGVATIEPRLIGAQPCELRLQSFELKKIADGNLDSSLFREPLLLENNLIKLKFNPNNATFSVLDKRTGREWKQNDETPLDWFVGDVTKPNHNTIEYRLLATAQEANYIVTITLENDLPEFVLSVAGAGSMTNNLVVPAPFLSQPGDRLIVPLNEGISYPAEMENPHCSHLIAYGGHGICMAFWGQVEDATGAGVVGIIETSDDAGIEIKRFNPEDLLTVALYWEPSRGDFAYSRSVRYFFFDQGAHLATCKRYRQYVQKTGTFVPFTEKVKRNPNIDLLLGAANIWYWGPNKVQLVDEMKAAGIDRILWSGGGTAEEIRELNERENVLTGRYDIYQDVMNPARFPELQWVHGDWVTEAWPNKINWTAPDGTWRRGWEVETKDPKQPMIPCGVICDSQAIPFAEKRISQELKQIPYRARFIDTTVAAPWFDCYHPDHPMNRSESRCRKMELLRLIGEFGLVCGSETGHDASVPYCDYFEGMLSLGHYRVDDAGRDMLRIIEDVPPLIEQFQINEKLRLPLWELVYHDCVVAQWYWGDYNNKLPKVWRKRDLFNALYGTPPMYMFTGDYWNANKERFIESYKTAQTVSRAAAYAEMTDHRLLSADRSVQQTVFDNGVTVTVNFGDNPYTLPDGTIIAPLDWTMQTSNPH